MFNISENISPKTAEEFIAFLLKVFGGESSSDRSVEMALDAWDEWERSGTSKPKNIREIAEKPMDSYRKYYKDIVKICDLDHLNASQIHFAICPTKKLNAYAKTLSNKDRVIVFDSHLIGFFTAIITTIMVCVYTQPEESEIDYFDDYIFRQFDNFFFHKEQTDIEVINETEQFITIIKKDYDLVEMGSYFSMAFTVFIICHELSHHLLGHSHGTELYALSNENADAIKIKFDSRSHQQEFEADQYGYDLFLKVLQSSDKVEHAKLFEAFNRAPLIFLEIIDIAYVYAETKGLSVREGDQHPSPQSRIESLKNYCESSLHEHGKELYDGFMDYSDHIRKVLTD